MEGFAAPFRGIIDYQILHGDFNKLISEVVQETKSSPAFFLVDPGGIKELKKNSVERIVLKKGARDIMLNYVINGPRRIKGLTKTIFSGIYKGQNITKDFKIIRAWEDFAGMKIYEQLDLDMKNLLKEYVKNVIEAKILSENEKLETIAYDMKHPDKADIIYYLLFSSRKNVALNIMRNIFTEAKKKGYGGQQSIFSPDPSQFEI